MRWCRCDLPRSCWQRPTPATDNWTQGQSRGWMHGMPQAVKDLAATAGLRTSMGSTLFAEHIPQHDAISVARVRDCGAIIIGKSNVPEFGLGSQTYNSVFGTTTNAYDPSVDCRWQQRRGGGGAGVAHAAGSRRQ